MFAPVCIKQGSGTPLLFLHGFLGNSSDWTQVIDHLHHTCYAIDLPGHGNSPFTPHFLNEFYSAAAPLAPFHLIGYSMGGRLALQYAVQFPQSVKSLILLSTHLGLKTDEERKRRLERDRNIAKEILQTPIDDFLKRWYDQPLFRTAASKIDLIGMRRKQNREALAQAVVSYSLGLQPDLSALLPGRTRILAGEHDLDYHDRAILIPNAGHPIHLEQPELVADQIKKAIDDNANSK